MAVSMCRRNRWPLASCGCWELRWRQPRGSGGAEGAAARRPARQGSRGSGENLLPSHLCAHLCMRGCMQSLWSQVLCLAYACVPCGCTPSVPVAVRRRLLLQVLPSYQSPFAHFPFVTYYLSYLLLSLSLSLVQVIAHALHASQPGRCGRFRRSRKMVP